MTDAERSAPRGPPPDRFRGDAYVSEPRREGTSVRLRNESCPPMIPGRIFQISLESSPSSVREARRFFVRVADEIGLSPEHRELGALALSELVTNAVVHGSGPVEVTAKDQGEAMRWEVADASPVAPRQRTAMPDASSGRGLAIVAAVAGAWGCDNADTSGGGKTVWFSLPVDPR